MADTKRLEALNDVLRVLVRHPNVLQRRAFEELAEATAAYAPFARLAVLAPEGGDHRRAYAITRGPDSAATFGSRIVALNPVVRSVFVEQKPFFRDDMREGN